MTSEENKLPVLDRVHKTLSAPTAYVTFLNSDRRLSIVLRLLISLGMCTLGYLTLKHVQGLPLIEAVLIVSLALGLVVTLEKLRWLPSSKSNK